MYLGKRSITALFHFLGGYHFAESIHGIECDPPLPRDFHDWVARNLQFSESTSGWIGMILKRVPDEAAAFDRFYELLDEYRRVPRS